MKLTKLKLAILVGGVALTYLSYRIWENKSGFCLETMSFTDDEQVMELAINRAIENIKVFYVSVNKNQYRTIEDYISKANDLYGTKTNIQAYNSKEEIISSLPPSKEICCEFSPHDDGATYVPKWSDKIFGWNRILAVNARKKYISDDGSIKLFYKKHQSGTDYSIEWNAYRVSNCGTIQWKTSNLY